MLFFVRAKVEEEDADVEVERARLLRPRCPEGFRVLLHTEPFVFPTPLFRCCSSPSAARTLSSSLKGQGQAQEQRKCSSAVVEDTELTP